MDRKVLNPAMYSRRSAAVLLRAAPVLLALAAILIFWNGVAMDALRILLGAGLIAFLITPLSELLEKRCKRPIASTLALAALVLALAGILGLLLPPIMRQSNGFLEMFPRLMADAKRVFGGIGQRFGFSTDTLPDIGIGSILQKLTDSIGEIAGKAYQIVLMFALGGFLCANRDQALLRMELAIPAVWRKTAVRAGMGFLREIRLYMRGQATIALAVGALSAVGLLILGIDGAIPLGLIVGLFNMIPYFGPVLGSVPAVLIALNGGWMRALLTVGVLFLVQQVDGLVISPRVMGGVTGFSPGVVLISLYLASRIAGIPGMLLALPCMMGIRTVYRVFVQSQEKH